jgi:hypothetical protein
MVNKGVAAKIVSCKALKAEGCGGLRVGAPLAAFEFPTETIIARGCKLSGGDAMD